MYHDSSQPVGLVTERVDTEEGMMFAARISATAAGDEALTLALDGVLDSVSVGVNPTRFSYDDEGTMIVTEAEWLELSLVPIPAFAGAEIEKVYASAENTVLASQEEPDTEPTPTEVERLRAELAAAKAASVCLVEVESVYVNPYREVVVSFEESGTAQRFADWVRKMKERGEG